MTQEFHLTLEKFGLFGAAVKICRPQAVEHLSDMCLVLFEGVGEYDNVVQVDDTSPVDQLAEGFL
jgi:hypothetical protein